MSLFQFLASDFHQVLTEAVEHQCPLVFHVSENEGVQLYALAHENKTVANQKLHIAYAKGFNPNEDADCEANMSSMFLKRGWSMDIEWQNNAMMIIAYAENQGLEIAFNESDFTFYSIYEQPDDTQLISNSDN